MMNSGKILRLALVSAALSALCVVSASAASIGVGTVNADALRLREEANTNCTILATASKGDTVVLLEEAEDNWYKVDYNTVQGYMSGDYLTVAQQAEVNIGYGLVDTDGATLNVRSGPGTDSKRVGALNSGDIVDIVGIDNGWYKIKAGELTGYVSSDYMTTCKDSAGSRGDDTAVASTSDLGQQVADFAKQFLGTPYVYGGNGPNVFDCSGFTNYVYRQFGYTINRGASSQLKNGTPVAKSDLQPGDIVFFRYKTSYPASHCGIYLGNGDFIHASTSGYKVRINNLNSGHYCNVYLTARRIF